MLRVLLATFKLVLQTIQVFERRAALYYPNAWNRLNGKGPREFKCLKKGISIPMQNMHDLLVGTLSIGIPSLFSLVSVVDHCTHCENELSPTN